MGRKSKKLTKNSRLFDIGLGLGIGTIGAAGAYKLHKMYKTNSKKQEKKKEIYEDIVIIKENDDNTVNIIINNSKDLGNDFDKFLRKMSKKYINLKITLEIINNKGTDIFFVPSTVKLETLIVTNTDIITLYPGNTNNVILNNNPKLLNVNITDRKSTDKNVIITASKCPKLKDVNVVNNELREKRHTLIQLGFGKRKRKSKRKSKKKKRSRRNSTYRKKS